MKIFVAALLALTGTTYAAENAIESLKLSVPPSAMAVAETPLPTAVKSPEQTPNGVSLRTLEMNLLVSPQFGFIMDSGWGDESIMAVNTDEGYTVLASITDDGTGEARKMSMKITHIPVEGVSYMRYNYRLEGKGISLELRKAAKQDAGSVLKLAVVGKVGNENIKLYVNYLPYGTEGGTLKIDGPEVELKNTGAILNTATKFDGRVAISAESTAAVLSIVMGMHADNTSFGDI